MSLNDDSDPTRDVPLEIVLRIDEICEAFELSHKRNEQPRIEDYLDEGLGEVETQLTELVTVEFAYLKKSGRQPALAEYTGRFPQHQHLLKKLLDEFHFEEPASHIPPPNIENLESFEFVGAGSFGAVWKAWDVQLRRFVAVKLPLRSIPGPRERDLIKREAQIVARTKHPNIVPVYYSGETDGRVYVVYEFVSGQTLQERLALAPFSAREAAALCLKITKTILHFHGLGIVHRDLKPSNILIGLDGEPHIMDFGLAKQLDADSTIGISGNPLGTPAYMSPEQWEGRLSDIDARSDIYSLGVILYELVSGVPVTLNERANLVPRTISGRAAALDVPESIRSICIRCLQKSRFDRYESASELAQDLELVQRGSLPRPVPMGLRWWKWARRHPGLLVLILLSVFAILAVALGALAYSKSPPPGSRFVRVVAAPPHAIITITPCSSETGEPEYEKVDLIASSPKTVSLPPGRYWVNAKQKIATGILSQEAHRTVPGLDGSWPSMGAIWERSSVSSTGLITWPPIAVSQPQFEMAYVEGADNFPVETSEGRKLVSISPFFVATREFTFGDFLKIRPGHAGNVPGRPATTQPADLTMPTRYDWAEQWAEESGCRLLTDIEFTYLAHLANRSQSQRRTIPREDERFDIAGGTTLDEIPTVPPIRGILTGFAEWTSTWPSSTRACLKPAASMRLEKRPERFRIIRGGTIDCSPHDYPRSPHVASVSEIYIDHPRVGFRLARTAAKATPLK